MSDLVERLRDQPHIMQKQGLGALLTTCAQAADRITALEAQIAAADRLEVAVGYIANSKNLEAPSEYNRGWNDSRFRLREIAHSALAAYHAARVQP